jgi:hypothetical protein
MQTEHGVAEGSQDPSAQIQTAQSQNQAGDDQYAKYFKMNGLDEGGNPLETTDPEATAERAINKDQAQPAEPQKAKPEQQAEQPRQKQSGHERRIEVLTARTKQDKEKIGRLESEIAKLKEAKPQPKLSRDHFATEDEYEDHRDAVRKEDLKREVRLENLQEQLEETSASNFKQTWTQKVSAFYQAPEDVQRYRQTLQWAKANGVNPHQDVHDYVQDVEVGPVMLEYLLSNPQVLNAINGSKPVVRASRLMQLEQAILQSLQSPPSEQPQSRTPQTQQRVSRAPDPVGQVGNGGAPASSDGDTVAEVRRYKQQTYGRRY